MKILLDSKIIIYKETSKTHNETIEHLFYWLEKLNSTKMLHPFSKKEIELFCENKGIPLISLNSYIVVDNVAEQSENFLNLVPSLPCSGNDVIENQLLFEVGTRVVDILITEDRGMIEKSKILGIQNQVFTINSFIEIQTSKYPDLIQYKALSVTNEKFENIDVSNIFFDSFKMDYSGFEE